MNETPLAGPIHLGFLTVFQEATAYLGGYLITNSWGRPLEFRLSTAVQPNRVQQILYGPTLQEYLCSDLIGKTLIDKSSTPIHLLFTDSAHVLPIRCRLSTPVLGVIPPDDPSVVFLPEHMARLPHERSSLGFLYDPRYDRDAEQLRALFEQLDPGLDVSEPFSRIREAIGEARKMGVTSRAA